MSALARKGGHRRGGTKTIHAGVGVRKVALKGVGRVLSVAQEH
jgi:hypothetical protein